MEPIEKEGGMEISQNAECKPMKTPMIRDVPTRSSGKVVSFPYSEAANALMYIMCDTRLDIAYSVNFFPRF